MNSSWHTSNEELHSFKAGALLPVLQAVVTGVLSFFLLSSFFLMVGVKTPGGFILFSSVLVTGVMWLRQVGFWVFVVHSRYYVPEPLVEVEPEPEPYVPPPSKVRVELLQDNAHQGEFLNLPASPEQLRLVAGTAIQGNSLSEGSLCGSKGAFTKAEWHALRKELIGRNWLQWRNPSYPAQGVLVTGLGRSVFSYLADEKHYTPSPTGTDNSW